MLLGLLSYEGKLAQQQLTNTFYPMDSQGENCLWKWPGFQTEFEDLRLKYCIQEKNTKNNISGTKH
jgi:hypothetical protein